MKSMNIRAIIQELERLGFKVDARRRVDGGWIITKINDMTFTGAKGNQYAREILGIELSQARIEQTKYNVEKYIRGTKKPKDKVDEELNRKLRTLQQKWRRHEVHAKITKRKLRWHLKEGGRKEAEEYLRKMSRYGEGLAYEENVDYLADYIRNVAKGMEETDKELAEASRKVADFVLSKKEVFKEAWISKVYGYWYDVVKSHYNGLMCSQAIMQTYSTIG